VREIDTTTQALASAVEEQTAATGEISSNAQQAAQGTRTVTVDVTGIQGAVSPNLHRLRGSEYCCDNAKDQLRAFARRGGTLPVDRSSRLEHAQKP
jgi:methyl-accepting chemotaxis protein